jgi:hypothetical protein
MKKIIIASLFALSTNAFAQGGSPSVAGLDALGNLDVPGQRNSLNVVGAACGIETAGLTGDRIQDGKDVVYIALKGETVVATARAEKGIFFKTKCED